MSGAGRLFIGIILIAVFFLTLTISASPIIWTGAGIVGAIFVFQGLREMVKGKQYKCKTCGYKGDQRTVLEHAYHAHPEQFSEEDRQKLAIMLGLQIPTATGDPVVEQPVEPDEDVGTMPE
ncbi:MAG: hypothetical protein ACTSU3_03410 [Candidatus Thorarchaeota archaeon]